MKTRRWFCSSAPSGTSHSSSSPSRTKPTEVSGLEARIRADPAHAQAAPRGVQPTCDSTDVSLCAASSCPGVVHAGQWTLVSAGLSAAMSQGRAATSEHRDPNRVKKSIKSAHSRLKQQTPGHVPHVHVEGSCGGINYRLSSRMDKVCQTDTGADQQPQPGAAVSAAEQGRGQPQALQTG